MPSFTAPNTTDPITIKDGGVKGSKLGTAGSWTFNSYKTASPVERLYYHFTGGTGPTAAPTFSAKVRENMCYFRFNGITIPQSATINTATLTINMSQKDLNYMEVNVGIFNSATTSKPAAPTKISQITQGNFGNTAVVTPLNIGSSISNAAYAPKVVNVQAMVNALVSLRSYSNGVMMFAAIAGRYGVGASSISFGQKALVHIAMDDYVGVTGPTLVVDYSASPDKVTTPSPANAADDQGLDTTLSWAAADGATSYDVYFGTTSPGAFQGNQAGTTFDPGALTAGETYFWRIDSKNASGTTTGDVWSFGAFPREADKTPHRFN